MKDVKVNASLAEWEENMVDELCAQYRIPDDVVLNIGITFLLNEMSASMNGMPSLLNSINPVSSSVEI